MTALEYAINYTRRGWQPLPIPHRSKYPIFEDWQKVETTEAEIKKHFNGAAQNIGQQGTDAMDLGLSGKNCDRA